MTGAKRIVCIAWLAMTVVGGRPALAQAPATGETERYAVEVLVFRYLNAPAEIGEPEGPAEQVFGDSATAVDRTTPDGNQASQPTVSTPPAELSYEPLAEDELQLSELEARLSKSRTYEALLHTGWIQDSFPADAAPSFDIGRTYAAIPDLTGTIRFSHGRYPHLDFDLTYRPEAASAAASPGYRLKEYRRLRDDELNYFDNAHFGVIARVTPWPPETAETPVPEDAPPAAAVNAPR